MKMILIAGAIVLGVLFATSRTRAQDSQGMRDAQIGLRLAATGSMVTTGVLGTLVAINKPTLFGDGRCAGGRPVFGQYGCHGLSTLHGVSAIVSLVLFTASTTVEMERRNWPTLGHGNAFGVGNWVSLIGMAALPVVGLVAAVPGLIGLELRDDSTFRRVLRTLHLGVGYTTIGTYVATTAVEI